MGLATVIGAIFGIEFIIFYFYTFFVIWSALFDEGMTPLLPIAMFGFMVISNKTSDTTHNISSLSDKLFAINFIIAASIVGVTLLVRLIFDIFRKQEFEKPAFILGLAVLVLAFCFGGTLSGLKTSNDSLFAILLSVCMVGPYLYFLFSVKSSNVTKDYIFYLLIVMGCVVAVQVIYKTIDLLWINPIEGYTIDGDYVKLGWGVKPEIGTTLAMSIPAFFYFMMKKKNGWFYQILATLIVVTLLLLRSRGPFVFGLLLYIALLIYSFIKTGKKERIGFALVTSVFIIALVVLCIIFKNQVIKFFQSTIDQFTGQHIDSDEERLHLYKVGLEHFLISPIFGVGWYQCPSNVPWSYVNNVLPPRYHDTVIQLLASTGLVGILAYGYHRFETIRFIIKKRSYHKTLIGLSILMLLLGSLLDTHLFNLACTIQYSVLLFALERIDSLE